MQERKKTAIEEIFEMLFNNEEPIFLGSFKMKDSFFNDKDLDFPQDGDENFNKTEEITETNTHTIKKESWKSLDGKQAFQRTTSESRRKENSKPTKESLTKLRDVAVAEHRYEDAAKFRDELLKLENK